MVKKGFTLAETLIVMAVISILFSVAAKVITTRPKYKKQSVSHGYFECYKTGGGMYQRTVRDEVATAPTSVADECVFTPPSGISFFNIHSRNPNASRFEPVINKRLRIRLGESIAFYDGNSNSYLLESDGVNTVDGADAFYQTIYPDSQLYNGATTGVMISW